MCRRTCQIHGVRSRRSERGDLSQTVGANSASLQRLPKLQRFLGSLSTGFSCRDVPIRGQRKRTNQSYGTLVWHLATVLCTFRPKNTILFKIRCNTQNRHQTLYHSIQSITYYLTITPMCKGCQSYSDFWEAYQLVFPVETHHCVGKGSGQTNHMERWYCTLRQKDIVLFKIRCLAQNRHQALYHSIQSITCYLTTTQKRR